MLLGIMIRNFKGMGADNKYVGIGKNNLEGRRSLWILNIEGIFK
jgi:hypothetical protein